MAATSSGWATSTAVAVPPPRAAASRSSPKSVGPIPTMVTPSASAASSAPRWAWRPLSTTAAGCVNLCEAAYEVAGGVRAGPAPHRVGPGARGLTRGGGSRPGPRPAVELGRLLQGRLLVETVGVETSGADRRGQHARRQSRERPGEDDVIQTAVHEHPLVLRGSHALVRRDEPGPHVGEVATEHLSGPQGPSVGDPAGEDHRPVEEAPNRPDEGEGVRPARLVPCVSSHEHEPVDA